MDNAYQRVAGLDDIAVGKTLCVQLGDREILLCHTREGYFAIDNLCSHAEARLSEGKLKGCKVLCPLHGAAFDVRDGSVLSRPASQPVATYPLKVDEQGIWVLPADR